MQLIEGIQTFQYQNGNVYHGNFKEGLPNGFGTMWYANGNSYVGEWCDGLRHGWGNIRQPDLPGYFHLQFDMGVPSGRGEIRYSDGETEAIHILKFHRGFIYFEPIEKQ